MRRKTKRRIHHHREEVVFTVQNTIQPTRIFNRSIVKTVTFTKKTAPRTKGETDKDSGPRQWVNGQWPDAANRGEAVGA